MSVDYAAARTNMVDSQVRPQDVTDLTIQDAMRQVAREALVPAPKLALSYSDAEIEYAPGRWMLRPRDVAKLLQALTPRAGDTALAISAPYAAKVLEAIGLAVTQCDAADSPPQRAGGWPIIICEGAAPRAPEAWTQALAPGGRLGVIERNGPVGRGVIYLRSGDTVGSRPIFDSTPPLMAGFEPKPTFTF
ncbi:MAG TPA: protein-L-isoaspartate O-methyltransferase [Caulobacteraceae bacterium]|jgi:protein-L-isoaspartate(D-aspartate) O-methyltransferase|nr:protein-L-isoaspartate O-methyltransferase [Caulobacteraceae bacterium]